MINKPTIKHYSKGVLITNYRLLDHRENAVKKNVIIRLKGKL